MIKTQALRAEMNKHGYFYNKTLDDFVKDVNWHAGELLDQRTLDGHIRKVGTADRR